MTIEKLAEYLEAEFIVRDYEWTFSPTEKRNPTKEEIMKGLEFLKDTTPDRHYRIGGHLIVVNANGYLDVYLHIGEIE